MYNNIYYSTCTVHVASDVHDSFHKEMVVSFVQRVCRYLLKATSAEKMFVSCSDARTIFKNYKIILVSSLIFSGSSSSLIFYEVHNDSPTCAGVKQST